MNLDFEICDGKSFRDLVKEVMDRSQSKKDQIDTLLSDIRTHIKQPNDAVVFLPQIKAFLEVGVKNDEQLIKLAAIFEKLQSTQIETSGGADGMLTDSEKEELLKNIKTDVMEIKKTVGTDDVPKK